MWWEGLYDGQLSQVSTRVVAKSFRSGPALGGLLRGWFRPCDAVFSRHYRILLVHWANFLQYVGGVRCSATSSCGLATGAGACRSYFQLGTGTRNLGAWNGDEIGILGLVSAWFSLRMMSYVLRECMGMIQGHFTLGPWMHEAAMEHEVFGSHCWTRRWWSSSTEISPRYVVIDCGCWYLVLYRIVQLSWCTLTNGFASGGSARSCLPLLGCKGDQPVDPTRRCVVVASIFVHAAVQCNVYCTCRYNCYMVYCMAYLICLITSCHLSGEVQRMSLHCWFRIKHLQAHEPAKRGAQIHWTEH